MKSLDDLAKKLERMANDVDKRVMEAQEKTAQQIWEDVIENAPEATGNYISSIEIEGPIKEGNSIKSFVGSGLQVGPTKSKGKSYNLGYLLEHGTNPHHIYPVESEFLVFPVLDKNTGEEKTIFTKHVWHPGTAEQPHYAIALQKNKKLFKDNIKLAWREK